MRLFLFILFLFAPALWSSDNSLSLHSRVAAYFGEGTNNQVSCPSCTETTQGKSKKSFQEKNWQFVKEKAISIGLTALKVAALLFLVSFGALSGGFAGLATYLWLTGTCIACLGLPGLIFVGLGAILGGLAGWALWDKVF